VNLLGCNRRVYAGEDYGGKEFFWWLVTRRNRFTGGTKMNLL
jgi:hypothetical protein